MMLLGSDEGYQTQKYNDKSKKEEMMISEASNV